MPAALRAGLHGHAAQELARGRATWDRVARHLVAAPEHLAGWALDWLAQVKLAELFALPDIAADLLGRARGATTSDDPRHGVFTARLAAMLRQLGRPDELIELAPEALDTVTLPGPRGEVAWYVARGYGASPGRQREGTEFIDRVLAGPKLDPPWRGRLLAQQPY